MKNEINEELVETSTEISLRISSTLITSLEDTSPYHMENNSVIIITKAEYSAAVERYLKLCNNIAI